MTDDRTREQRLGALRAELELRELEAAVLLRDEHVFLLTGFMPDADSVGGVVVSRDRATLITATSRPIDVPVGWETYPIEGGLEPQRRILRALERYELVGRLGVEAETLTLGLASGIRAQRLDPIDDFLDRLRAVKSEWEVDEIRKAVDRLDHVMRIIPSMVRPGSSERDLYLGIRSVLERDLPPLNVDACIGSGPRTADPACRATTRVIEDGDLVMVDLFPAQGAFYADLCRMFVCGRATDLQKRRHDQLRIALDRTLDQILPGVLGRQVFEIGKAQVEALGFPLLHHAGHGIGLFQHERPVLVADEEMEITSHTALAVELGFYEPGWGGMRLETNCIIGDSGPMRLDRAPMELIECRA